MLKIASVKGDGKNLRVHAICAAELSGHRLSGQPPSHARFIIRGFSSSTPPETVSDLGWENLLAISG